MRFSSALIVLSLLIHVAPCFSQESEGVVMQRIGADRTLLHYYNMAGDSGRKLIGAIDDLAVKLGRMPSRSETLQILANAEVNLSQLERLWFETVVRGLQKPQITSQSLFEKYHKFSTTVPPLNCSFHATVQSRNQKDGLEPGAVKKLNLQFSRSDDGGTLLSLMESPSGDSNVVRQTWILDGFLLHTIREVKVGSSYESIQIPTALNSLCPEYHPFTIARIAPEFSVRDPSLRMWSGNDVFKDGGTVVFETPEIVDGREYLVVGFLDWALLLDPSLNHAIVEERFGDLDFSGRYSAREWHHRKLNSDFVKMDNGCYLPRRSVVEVRSGDGSFTRHEIVIDSLQISPRQNMVKNFERPKNLTISNQITGENYKAD